MAAEIATVVVGVVLGIGAFIALRRAPAVMRGWRAHEPMRSPDQVPTRSEAMLPPVGERLVFGIHSQHPEDAESAPAWPSLDALAERRLEVYRLDVARAAGQVDEAEYRRRRSELEEGA